MFHIPITDSKNPEKLIEFSYTNRDANIGEWIKENLICLDHFKINIFIQGDFSVVVEDKRCNPIYGDLCILPPNAIHYGQIIKRTHINYYQFDIWPEAFNGIPGGKQLVSELAQNAKKNNSFLRPDKATANLLIQLAKKAEDAVASKKFTAAFIYITEIVYHINSLYKNKSETAMQVLSALATNVIQYIEQNYASSLSMNELSKYCKVSSSYIARQFKKEVGVTVHSYLNNYRILKSTDFLKSCSVAQTAYLCGFADSSHFISVFKRTLGMTPTEYLKRK